MSKVPPNKQKYGNIESMLATTKPSESQTDRNTRRRRPLPAIGVVTGDTRPLSATEALYAEKEAAEKALETARQSFEEREIDLVNQLNAIKLQIGDSQPITLTMPVTRQPVEFTLRVIDPARIVVSPENERIQEFLDEISLKDILPSIKKHGQQKPGTVRPIPDGRYELIEGSRRLAAVKLAGLQYIALIGDVPDADVRELGIIENRHQDVSPYEKALSYARQIRRGEYENWTQLGAAKGISSSHISRYRACAELDEIFVRILPSPSDMSLTYGETIAALRKKDFDRLQSQAIELLSLRANAAQKNQSFLEVDEVLKLLKDSVKTTTKSPTVKKPVVYRNEDAILKHTISNRGTTKFEIEGVEQEKIDKILELIRSALKV